jgi:hypothetical protein
MAGLFQSTKGRKGKRRPRKVQVFRRARRWEEGVRASVALLFVAWNGLWDAESPWPTTTHA